MAHSFKLDIRSDAPKKDGTAALFIQVIIDRAKTTVALNLSWPVEKFNKEARALEPISRSKHDQKVLQDYNIIINAELSKVNDIFAWYRIARQTLTIDLFQSELANYATRQNFLIFWAETTDQEYKDGIIKKGTYKNMKATLGVLTAFRETLMFSEVNEDLLAKWKAHMLNKLHYDINTVWARLKDFRTMFNRARKKGMVFSIESKDIKLPKTHRRITYLDEAEFGRILAYFNSELIENRHSGQKRTLRAFLFSCYTGLRVSDLQQLNWSHIDGDFIQFTPQKTAGMVASLRIPLSQKAQQLIVTRTGSVLDCISDQKMNDYLKEIALECDIKKKLTMHVGRHTFATRLLSSGGKLERLKELLGHVKIDSTMIYVHVSEEDMKHDVNLL